MGTPFKLKNKKDFDFGSKTRDFSKKFDYSKKSHNVEADIDNPTPDKEAIPCKVCDEISSMHGNKDHEYEPRR